MTGSARLRWGVLGTAGINERVVPAIARSAHGEVVAIASRTPSRAEAAAEQFGIGKPYGSYEELLADPDVDAVYIPLPNFLHHHWVLAAAAAGKHILCEKPMAITVADAQEMVAAAADAGVVLMEAFMYAHHPRYDQLHELVRSREMGTVRGISGTFTFDASDEPEATIFQGNPGSGAIYDVGCYIVHAARRLLGTEPLAVTAQASYSGAHGGADMMTSALVEFPDDVGLLLQCGMWTADTDTLTVLGSRGRVDVPSAFFAAPGVEGFLVQLGDDVRLEQVPDVDHYISQADDLAEAVLHGRPVRLAPADAVRNAAVVEALVRSARTRSRVLVEDV